MGVHIALLRGVNVGGAKRLAMSDLAMALESAGLRDVRTLLQSGNAVFGDYARSAAALEPLIEAVLTDRLGLQCDVHVRTAKEWDAVIAANPLRDMAEAAPSGFLVTVFRTAPEPVDAEALQAAVPGQEVVRVVDRQLYASYPDGMGRSKLDDGWISRHLGVRGTGRNWNTVRKLQAMAVA